MAMRRTLGFRNRMYQLRTKSESSIEIIQEHLNASEGQPSNPSDFANSILRGRSILGRGCCQGTTNSVPFLPLLPFRFQSSGLRGHVQHPFLLLHLWTGPVDRRYLHHPHTCQSGDIEQADQAIRTGLWGHAIVPLVACI
jgi:hypothetical protein